MNLVLNYLKEREPYWASRLALKRPPNSPKWSGIYNRIYNFTFDKAGPKVKLVPQRFSFSPDHQYPIGSQEQQTPESPPNQKETPTLGSALLEESSPETETPMVVTDTPVTATTAADSTPMAAEAEPFDAGPATESQESSSPEEPEPMQIDSNAPMRFPRPTVQTATIIQRLFDVERDLRKKNNTFGNLKFLKKERKRHLKRANELKKLIDRITREMMLDSSSSSGSEEEPQPTVDTQMTSSTRAATLGPD